MGNLYIVATPIGNLQDISFRALTTLNSVDYILCEDTRKTGNLLSKTFKMMPLLNNKKTQLVSYYEENEMQRIPEVIKILQMDFNVALVSDAGTPAISDPGFKLIRECVKEKIKVISIPGPSSVISALVSSGLPTDKFMFLGFLPKKEGHRIKLLNDTKETLKVINQTVIFFESPFRLVKTLEELKQIFGDINVAVARELTKMHEELKYGKISEVSVYFKSKSVKGEIVILFNLK